MGREHVIQSWVKHDEDDWRVIPPELLNTASGYSGEQVGQRIATNNGNTAIRAVVPGWLPNGRADIAGAADPAEDAKGDPLLMVDPAFKTLLEYPGKVAALTKAYEAGKMPESLYRRALRVLDVKADKAQRKIDKLAGSVLLEEENAPEEEPELDPVVLEEDAIASYQPTPEEEEEAINNYKNSYV
jgi:hypothetical protein|nr:MAG TPA: hypothetical protein [Caudoviricetes sp.]